MDVSLHAAVAANDVIGRQGGMPWRLSTDLKRFKATTLGKPVIMGRKTFESIGKALPGRINIVVTRDPGWQAEGAAPVRSLADALTLAEVRARCLAGDAEACIIGGGQIYAEAIPLADRLHITHVLSEVEGDTHFPPIDPAVWRAVSDEFVPAGPMDDFATRHVVYARRQA